MHGNLKKKSQSMSTTSWSTKYCLLFKDALCYCETSRSGLIGILPMELVHYVTKFSQQVDGCRFDILLNTAAPTEKRTFIFRTDSAGACDAWVTALKKQQQRYEYVKQKTALSLSNGKFWHDIEAMCLFLCSETRQALEKFKGKTKRQSMLSPRKVKASLSLKPSLIDLERARLEIDTDSEDYDDLEDSESGGKMTLGPRQNSDEGHAMRKLMLSTAKSRVLYQGLLRIKPLWRKLSKYRMYYCELFADCLDYSTDKQPRTYVGKFSFSQIHEVIIPSKAADFVFEVLIKTSKHDDGRRWAIACEDNNQLFQWVKVLKENLYTYHLKIGSKDDVQRALAVGVAPDIWQQWEFDHEEEEEDF